MSALFTPFIWCPAFSVAWSFSGCLLVRPAGPVRSGSSASGASAVVVCSRTALFSWQCFCRVGFCCEWLSGQPRFSWAFKLPPRLVVAPVAPTLLQASALPLWSSWWGKVVVSSQWSTHLASGALLLWESVLLCFCRNLALCRHCFAEVWDASGRIPLRPFFLGAWQFNWGLFSCGSSFVVSALLS